jgi:hypothetical protein
MRHNRHSPTGPPEHPFGRFGPALPHAGARNKIIHK